MTAPTYSGTLKGSDGSSLLVAGLQLVPAPTTPDPDPQPDPGTLPTPTGRRRILWHYGWNGLDLDALPVDVRACLTDVVLAMCESASKGTGRLADPPGVTRAQVTSFTSKGVEVHVGIGGSNGGGITLKTGQNVSELVASVLAMRSSFGITGARWDLETDPGSNWTVDAVVQASRQLIAAGLRVGIWSALYGGRLEAWGAVAQALGAELHVWERGFYDFPQANDSRLSGIVTSSSTGLRAMRKYVQRGEQLAASFAPVGATSKTPASVAAAAYSAGLQAVPGAGWSVWHDRDDAGLGWGTTRALAVL